MHLKYEILLRNCINTRLNTDKTNDILKLPHIPSNKNFYQKPHSKIAWSIMRSEMIWNAKQLSQDRKIWCRTFNKKRRNKKEIPFQKALVSLLYSTCFQTANKQKSLIRERFFMTRIQCLFFAACSWKPLITRTFYALWNHFLFGMHRNKVRHSRQFFIKQCFIIEKVNPVKTWVTVGKNSASRFCAGCPWMVENKRIFFLILFNVQKGKSR